MSISWYCGGRERWRQPALLQQPREFHFITKFLVNAEEADGGCEHFFQGDLNIWTHVLRKLPHPRYQPARRHAVKMPVENLAGVFELLILRLLGCICDLAGDNQAMCGITDTLLRLGEQRSRNPGRIGAASDFTPSDQPGKRDRIAFRLAENVAQEVGDKLHGRVAVVLKDKLERRGIGGNVVHINSSVHNLGGKGQKKNITKPGLRQAQHRSAGAARPSRAASS